MKQTKEKTIKQAVSKCPYSEFCKYKRGFNILMEYWDSIADEEKPKVDRRLKRLGL